MAGESLPLVGNGGGASLVDAHRQPASGRSRLLTAHCGAEAQANYGLSDGYTDIG